MCTCAHTRTHAHTHTITHTHTHTHTITPNGGCAHTPECIRLRVRTFTRARACAHREKNEVVVEGQLVDSETIRANTPNYEMYGALAVDIRVSINGEGWTVNKIKFNYFANTAARNCIAYGPGLLPQGVYGVEMPFVIQVREPGRGWGPARAACAGPVSEPSVAPEWAQQRTPCVCVD